MSAYALSPEFGVLASDSDRRFRRLLAGLALPALIAGIAIPFFEISGLLKGGGMLTPTRYAKLIEQPAFEEEVPVEKKVEPKPKPTKPQLTQEQKVEKARKKAEKAIASLRDSLAELRESDLPTVDAPLSGEVITSQSSTSPSFASSAASTSGGIGETGVVRRSESETGLAQRRTTAVKSPVGEGAEKALSGHSGKIAAGRTAEELQAVFDRSKGAFYSMYQRLLRENPNARGKIVLRMTIAPSGRVTKCTMVSSEFNNPEFEKKVIARVLLLEFGAKDVGEVTLDYPIHFFPQN